MLKSVLVPIHREGWPFVGGFALVSAGIAWWFEPLGYIVAILTAWCAYFFRDPERVTPLRAGLVISPADGVVESIVKATPPEELKMGERPLTRVAIFMNIFNVHINRIPIDGTISVMNYKSGRFFNASLDKASIHNERQSLKITTTDGTDIAFVQIAGLIARRIRCWVTIGSKMQAGERFGLIRFGSRVDVYLPEGIQPFVSTGQTVIAGESVLADLLTDELARDGEIR